MASRHPSLDLSQSERIDTSDANMSTPLSAEFSSELDAELSRTGQPLTSPVRAKLEGRAGLDLSSVRVHQGQRAATIADGLGASALTVGNHVLFARDQYQPATDSGQTLLAHEVAHTLQPSDGKTVRRSTDKPDDLVAMGELINLLWQDRASEITTEKLKQLTDERLLTLLESALSRRAIHASDLQKHQSDEVGNEFTRGEFANHIRLIDKAIGRINTILRMRGNILASRNYSANMSAVRDSITDDIEHPFGKTLEGGLAQTGMTLNSEARCIFDLALPRIPRFLESYLHSTSEPEPTRDDRLYTGYLSVNTVESFYNNYFPVTPENILREMTVLPRTLARAFYLNGDDVELSKKAIEHEYLQFEAGLNKLSILEESGTTLGDTPIEALALGVDTLQKTPGTLYSCKPTVNYRGTVVTDDSDLVHQIAGENATKWLKNNQQPLAETWEIETLGKAPPEIEVSGIKL